VGHGVYDATTTQAMNDGAADCGSSMDSPDVWFRYHSSEYEYVVIEITEADFDPVLSIHVGCPGMTTNQRACDDDSVGVLPKIGFQAYENDDTWIRVSGFDGAVGSFTLSVSNGASIQGAVSPLSEGPWPRVYAYHPDGYQAGMAYVDIETREYVLDALGTGTYFVATSNSEPRYVGEVWDDHPCPLDGSPCDPLVGDPVVLHPGQTVTGIDFDLQIRGSISGTVVNRYTLEPVQYQPVRLHDVDLSQRETVTDVFGAFSFAGLNDGTYYVVAGGEGHEWVGWVDVPCPGGLPSGCDTGNLTALTVSGFSAIQDIDFQLRPYGSISGTITDRTTGLVPNASSWYVFIYDEDGHRVTDQRFKEPDGAYTVSGLPDGTYYVNASAGWSYYLQHYDGIDCSDPPCDVLDGTTPLVISGMSDLVDIDFGLLPRPRISGTTSSPSGTTPDLTVYLYKPTGYIADTGDTDDDGTFSFGGLYPGHYYLMVRGDDFFDELYDDIPCEGVSCEATNGTPIQVPLTGTVDGIDIVVDQYGRITGTAVGADSGEPVSTRINVHGLNGDAVGWAHSYQGSYDIGGLADDQFLLWAEMLNEGAYLPQLYDQISCWQHLENGCPVLDGTAVSTSYNTNTEGIDFVLEPAGTISGTVVDAVDGFPTAATVTAIRDDDAWIRYGSVDVNADGVYTVAGLTPGTYTVLANAVHHIDEFWPDSPCPGPFPEACPAHGGIGIPMTLGGSAVDVDFTLDRAATISGQATDGETGEPLTNLSIWLINALTNHETSERTGYSDGNYEFTGVYPGTYHLGTRVDTIAWIDVLYDGIACPGGIGIGCVANSGTPVVVQHGAAITGIDLPIGRPGGVSGRVTSSETGNPLRDIAVKAYDATGAYIETDYTNDNGMYELRKLKTGIYYVGTDRGSPYTDQLYDDIPCWGGLPDGCDPTKGTPVSTVNGTVTRFVDFVLPRLATGVAGAVTDAVSGAPIADIRVDFWDTSEEYQGTAVTARSGTFTIDLDAGTYFAATDNNLGWANRIWGGDECEGSPYNGDCDPYEGATFEVTSDSVTEGIDFTLNRSRKIFENGFESGTTTGWSSISGSFRMSGGLR
jgi:hypothetical protein